MTGFDDQINDVTRSVAKGERDGEELRTVALRQVYPTSVEDLWDACTTAERLARWFLPVSGDLQLGGRYQFEGNAGGTIERCEPLRMVSVTWEFGGFTSWVELWFGIEGDGAWLELRHDQLFSEFWEQFGSGATGVGWDMGLYGLRSHLASGVSRDAVDEAAAFATEEGQAFIRQLAAAWGEASIVGGEDAAWAREAAARTEAFYTTTPEGES